MKNFLRRKPSKVTSDEKPNKSNAKSNGLPVIEDETQSQHSNGGVPLEMEGSAFSPTMNRRASIAETVDSTSTTDSKKKKEGYRARLAAQSQAQPQLGPWMAMTPMSHSTLTTTTKPKPKPKAKANGSLNSAAQSTESVPASISISVASAELPSHAPPSPSYPPPNVPSSTNPQGRKYSPMGGSSIGASPVGSGHSPLFPSSRSSLMVPPSPSVNITPPSLPPKPPPNVPLPPPPVPMPNPQQTPVMIAPLGPLANPFRTDPPAPKNEPVEAPLNSPRAPPPPPPPPVAPQKLLRNPSRAMPPPSAFNKHKRSLSGRVSPNPSLPNLPIPPPPPPASAPPPPPPRRGSSSNGQPSVESSSTTSPFPPHQSNRDSVVSPISPTSHFRNESLSNFPEPPTSARTPQSATWDSFVPDLTGYYGGNSSFVAELDNIPTFPEPPSGNPSFEQQELDIVSPSNDAALKAAEDRRETSKVLLPEGVLLHPALPTPSDTTTNRNDSVFSNPPDTQPKMTDGVFLTTSEHSSLLSEISELRNRVDEVDDLRARLEEADKVHVGSLERITEWEAYKANMDTYLEKMTQDRQILIEKLQNSAQAHSTVVSEKERQYNELAATMNQMRQTILDWQTYSQKIEGDKTEAITTLTKQIEREKADNLANIQAMDISHNDEIHKRDAGHEAELNRIRAAHAAQMERLQRDHADEIDRLTLENDSARTEYENQKTELMGQLSALDTQHKELMPKMIELDTQRRNLQGDLAGARADLEDTKQEVDKINSAKIMVVKELQSAKAKLANLTTEHEKTKRLLEEAQPKVEQLAEAKRMVERMKETEISLEKFLRTANDEKDKLKEKLQASNVAKGRLGTALSNKEAELKDMEVKVSNLEKANEGLKRRMHLLGQRMAAKVEWYQEQTGQAQTAS